MRKPGPAEVLAQPTDTGEHLLVGSIEAFLGQGGSHLLLSYPPTAEVPTHVGWFLSRVIFCVRSYRLLIYVLQWFSLSFIFKGR